eukprot:CAMPEP_0180272122 /NCGR_PEP_ID=MMETSP0988-20121125/4078_1 /TAXON_ID=697907 /ORGANISM="non described non described, Strain CCMP2293" /LENGTH=123 /DNA_ID=CAMNT_0022243175 /DNA_START=39 /DNA_END=407 /DNA_ORIENTATION=+
MAGALRSKEQSDHISDIPVNTTTWAAAGNVAGANGSNANAGANGSNGARAFLRPPSGKSIRSAAAAAHPAPSAASAAQNVPHTVPPMDTGTSASSPGDSSSEHGEPPTRAGTAAFPAHQLLAL